MTRVDEIVVLAGVDSGGATRLLKVNEDGTIAGGGGGSTTALADLTDDVDVVSTPPIEGDALVFDGSKWVPIAGDGSVATAPIDLPATGDLTLTSSGTDYDAPGVSVELPAGTYRFEANGVILASAGNVYLYIWDGTTKYGGSAVSVTTLAGGYVPMSAYAIVTLETTTTVKLSVRSNAGGNQLISNPDSVVGIGTHMSYERIG